MKILALFAGAAMNNFQLDMAKIIEMMCDIKR
jgi:hypothetical protein